MASPTATPIRIGCSDPEATAPRWKADFTTEAGTLAVRVRRKTTAVNRQRGVARGQAGKEVRERENGRRHGGLAPPRRVDLADQGALDAPQLVARCDIDRQAVEQGQEDVDLERLGRDDDVGDQADGLAVLA